MTTLDEIEKEDDGSVLINLEEGKYLFSDAITINEDGEIKLKGFTAGSVLFAGTDGKLSEDNSDFFWDDTNKRLGIGTLVPGRRLHIKDTVNLDIQIETTAVNGQAGFRLRNDVGQWRFSIGTSDEFVIKDITNNINKLQIDSGGTSNPLKINIDELVINESGEDLNFRVESTTRNDIIFVDAGNDIIQLGNPTVNEVQISKQGDMIFIGGGGLPFGSFWGNEIAFVSAGGTGTFFEISDANITAGQTHNTTFQNNKEIAVSKAGMYLVSWSMSVKGTGAGKHLVGGIGVDTGGAGSLTIQNDGRNHAITLGASEMALSGHAILDLSASSEVGIMATNETDNSNVTVEHVNLTITQVGGT